MKKSIALAMALMATLTISAFATNNDNVECQEATFYLEVTPEQEALWREHYVSIEEAIALGENVVYEHEMLAQLQATSSFALLAEGYTPNEILEIKNTDYEAQLLEEVFSRAQLSDEVLLNMGYCSEEIAQLRNLSGSETLEDVASFALAKVTCYNNKVQHYYTSSKDRTYFSVSFGWAWDKRPVNLYTDMMGIGWNHDFSVDYSYQSSYNIVNVKYVKDWFSPIETTFGTLRLVENVINTCETRLKMANAIPSDPYFWPKEGFGTIFLSQQGRADNAKLEMKYGHAGTAVVPSISKGGVGFSFRNVMSTFAPPAIVNSNL